MRHINKLGKKPGSTLSLQTVLDPFAFYFWVISNQIIVLNSTTMNC